MRTLYCILFLLTACASTPSQPPPEWVMKPPDNQVTSCTMVGSQDQHTLKDVTTIKAKAEYLAQQKAIITQERTITKRSTASSHKSEVYMVELTKQQVDGYVNHHLSVQQAQRVEFNNQSYFCVRYGLASK